MARHVVLLRGINLVRYNRIAMPELRAVLEEAGYGGVRTYVQSGNILLTSPSSDEDVGMQVRSLIKSRFGLDITVLVRSRDDLASVVERNPLAGIAGNPRRYIVTFLSHEVPAGLVDDLHSVAGKEPVAVIGREVYSWHPEGVGRTPLLERLVSRSPGLVATSRNWTTVTTLLAMADAPPSR